MTLKVPRPRILEYFGYRDISRMEDNEQNMEEGGLGCVGPESYLYTTESIRKGSHEEECAGEPVDPKLHSDRAESICESSGLTPLMLHTPDMVTQKDNVNVVSRGHSRGGARCASGYQVSSSIEDTLKQSEPDPFVNLMGRGFAPQTLAPVADSIQPSLEAKHSSGSDMSVVVGDISKLSLARQPAASQSGVSIDLAKLNLTSVIDEQQSGVVWQGEAENLQGLYVGQRSSGCAFEEPIAIQEVGVGIEPEDPLPHLTQEMIKQQDYDGDTILHTAIIQEMIDLIMKVLMKITCYSVLNVENNLKQTPLHVAVLTRQPRAVRALVSHGAQIDVRDSNGNTPLHLACKRGSLNCAKELTRPLGQSEVAGCRYQVPFQRIPQDPTLLNYEGKSCLHLAADSGNVKLLEYLLSPSIGHNVNIRHGCTGRTILHDALTHSHLGLITYLMHNSTPLRLDVNCRAFDGTTPLNLAAGNEAIVAVLKQVGAVEEHSMVT